MQRIFPNPFDRPVQAPPSAPYRQQPKPVWEQDAGGATDESIRRLRQRAAKGMQQASDTGPVGHWLQGAARLADGFSAGLDAGKADRQEAALNDLAHRNSWYLSSQYPDLFGSAATVAPMNLAPQPRAGLFGLGGRLAGLFGTRGDGQPSGSTGGLW